MKSAPNAAERLHLAQQCVKCGLCLPHCPTYRLQAQESESPRGRIALMAALAEGADVPGPLPSLDHCLGCRRCESACPANVAYESLLLATRAVHPPLLSLRAKLALWLMAHKSLLNGALAAYRAGFRLLPKSMRILPQPPAVVPVSGAKASQTAVFVGCVADHYEQGTRAALFKLLNAIGENAAIPAAQGCCGQAARHAGSAAQADALARDNQAAFAGFERALVLASGCHSALAGSLPIPVQDALDFLAERAHLLHFKSAHGRHAALHIPCSAAFQGSAKATQTLLARIPDLQLSVLPDTGCCGAAGLHQLSEPTRADALRAPLLAGLPADADVLLSANIGCRLHLAQSRNTVHPIEFMAHYLT